jgi:hypothetical protein
VLFRFNWIASIHTHERRFCPRCDSGVCRNVTHFHNTSSSQYATSKEGHTLMLNGSPFRDRRRFYSQQSCLSRSFESTRIAPTCNPKVGKPTIDLAMRADESSHLEHSNTVPSTPAVTANNGKFFRYVVGCSQRSASFEVRIS